MTSKHTIHADRRRDTDDVPITARVDRLEADAGPFAVLNLRVGDDELALIVTRPTNARNLARALARALPDLDDWATDQPAPDPDPNPGRVLAYKRAAS